MTCNGYAPGMGWVLFFDGDCGLCSRSVRWIARLDRQARISFAPLQGRLAAEFGLSGHASLADGSMVLLREADACLFLRSDALIELGRAAGGILSILLLLRFVPRWIRDGVYRWIAKNRRRLGGTSSHCTLPDPELLARIRE